VICEVLPGVSFSDWGDQRKRDQEFLHSELSWC
jgi:hypothetical protein